ncbi:MAG TPA: hypothetical protein VGS20_00465 [Candidatus Acidoferrales bacterium]|nr:hypothetical protein [Candidatus Acidoferrales bacterium]
MIAALILVVSVAAFFQFFLFYTRSLLAGARHFALSENVLEIIGIDGQMVQPAQFGRLLQLVELCPGPGNDDMGIRAVRTYFGGLGLLLSVVPRLPSGWIARAAAWIERERQACAYFAAAALDQRMAYSRTLLSNDSGS